MDQKLNSIQVLKGEQLLKGCNMNGVLCEDNRLTAVPLLELQDS